MQSYTWVCCFSWQKHRAITSLLCRCAWHPHPRYSQGLRLGECILNKREKRSSVSVQRHISCSPFVVFQSRHDDRDCQQASPLYQLCGWRTFANWCVMPAVCSLLQVCRCTVVNSPWGWCLWKREIFCALNIHDGCGGFEEVALASLLLLFGFLGTFFTTIPLHSAVSGENLATVSAFSGLWHTCIFMGSTFLLLYLSASNHK